MNEHEEQEQARLVIENPAFKAVTERLKTWYIDGMVASAWNDPEEREHYYYCAKVLSDVVSHLNSLSQGGGLSHSARKALKAKRING
jgi:hypothetical protein